VRGAQLPVPRDRPARRPADPRGDALAGRRHLLPSGAIDRVSCGKTPHQYLVERRVEVAKSILLRDDVPLAEVAYRLGFADQSHFTRHFRRITGASPGRLRRAHRPAH
jgi:AraC-like DNA-binding protein